MAVTPTDYVSASLAAYPALLNRYLVAKLISGIESSPKLETAEPPKRSSTTSTEEPPSKRAQVNYAEQVSWTRRLRGEATITDKHKLPTTLLLAV